jgi:hypothetical protein
MYLILTLLDQRQTDIFEIPIQLNIENTVFNTNTDEFPYEIINFVLLLPNTLSIAVNGPIICQPLNF